MINNEGYMKKMLFLAAAMLILCAPMVDAQVKLSWNGPIDIEWKVKRCYAKGETCVVDLVVENNSSQDASIQLGLFPDSWCDGGILIHDDEGNVYNWEKVSGTFGGGDITGYGRYRSVDVPKGTLVKFHYQIAEMDEFATVIKSLKFPMQIKTKSGSKVYELRISNLPITRD